jgi:hypothetical protein
VRLIEAGTAGEAVAVGPTSGKRLVIEGVFDLLSLV